MSLKKIKAHPDAKRIAVNVAWLSLDKLLRMGVGLFVLSWIAKYLGPNQFGLLNYAIALTALFGAFSNLGIDSIVVRELVRTPERKSELLGTAFYLRLSGSVVALVVCVIAVWILQSGQTLAIILVALSAGGFIFQSFLTIDLFYQAQIKSRYTVWAQNLAFLMLAVVKILLVLNKAPLVAFGVAGLAEIIVAMSFLTGFYFLQGYSLKHWKFSVDVAKELLKESWPMLLSGISIMIYMRIDQVMIGQMLGNNDVGLYSAAVRVSEVWYFIPVSIASSVFPIVVKSRELGEKIYYARLQLYFTLMTWVGIIVAGLLSIFSPYIINVLFGSDYTKADNILSIHVWAGVFVCMGVASNGWFIAEGLQKLNFYRTLMGAICNVILNIFLIQKYGPFGAAIATVASYSLSAFWSDLFNRATFEIFRLKVKGMFFIFKIRKQKNENV